MRWVVQPETTHVVDPTFLNYGNVCPPITEAYGISTPSTYLIPPFTSCPY